MTWIQYYRLPRCFDSLLVLAELRVFVPQIVRRYPVSGVGVPPHFVVVDDLGSFSADVLVISGGQVKPLPLAGAFSQLERLFQILLGHAVLAQVGVHRAQTPISESELRIELACAPEERNGLGSLTLAAQLIS